MIFDRLENAKLYDSGCPGLAKAVEFASRLSSDAPNGRIEIDGDAMYASVSSYTTRPAEEAPFESHRKYIDVQIVLAGEERMDVSQETHLPVRQAYSAKDDFSLFDAPKSFASVALQPGCFAVLFPHDAHRPTCTLHRPQAVRKLVVKIRV